MTNFEQYTCRYFAARGKLFHIEAALQQLQQLTITRPVMYSDITSTFKTLKFYSALAGVRRKTAPRIAAGSCADCIKERSALVETRNATAAAAAAVTITSTSDRSLHEFRAFTPLGHLPPT